MVENWQFFLQKEGDYAWLPLETPQVEILEGRYQLIAHTSNPGQAVQVNIRHQYEQADIPQENIQESIRQIGLSGKVEILPLVYLGLGSWSISCQPNIDIDESHSSTESYGLEIQVLSQDFDLFEDWDFSDSDMNDGASSTEKNTVASVLIDAESAPENVMPTAIVAEEAERKEPAIAEIDETHVPPSLSSNAIELNLPNFSTSAPSRAFRTVSSTELPRPVTDRELPISSQAPQLPVFSQGKAAAVTQQKQRARSLTKIRFIAAAVSQRGRPEIKSSTRQEKFHSKLNQIAIGAHQ